MDACACAPVDMCRAYVYSVVGWGAEVLILDVPLLDTVPCSFAQHEKNAM